MTRLVGVARVGKAVTLEVFGSGFHGRPTVTSNEPGTVALVLHDSGKVLIVRVSLMADSAKGWHLFTFHFSFNGEKRTIKYRVN